jgi:hypothetical protein
MISNDPVGKGCFFFQEITISRDADGLHGIEKIKIPPAPFRKRGNGSISGLRHGLLRGNDDWWAVGV